MLIPERLQEKIELLIEYVTKPKKSKIVFHTTKNESKKAKERLVKTGKKKKNLLVKNCRIKKSMRKFKEKAFHLKE